VKNEKLPKTKIMFLSDLHSETFHDLHNIAREEKVNYIFITGDLFDSSEETGTDSWEELIFNLREISYKIPIYCSLGNHEIEHSTIEYVKNKLEKNNLNLLDDEWVDLNGILVYGFTPSLSRNQIIKTHILNFPEEPDKTIVLCHKPLDYINCVSKYNPFLTLSGHNHGGQWRFFGHGIYAPDEGLFPKYTSGFYFDNKLLVSRGLGNKCMFPRINNNSQVIILTIN
jgi:predicted MPP superfamily phosphohydrolase